jgi:general stress protein 26
MTTSRHPDTDTDTDMEVRRDSDAIDKLHDLIAETRFAMFGTYDSAGTCHSRPMAAVEQERDSDVEALWFFTRAESRKVAEIAADPRVTVDYADASGQNYVSVTGRAEIVDDRDRIAALWSEPMRTWFPNGKDDPAIRLVRVVMETAEYWDAPSSAMVFAFGYARSRLTGEPPSPGEVAQVRL